MDVAAMLKRQGGLSAADEYDDFEWVNAWAEQSADAGCAAHALMPSSSVQVLLEAFTADAARAALAVEEWPIWDSAGFLAPDLGPFEVAAPELAAQDLVAIEKARDALLEAQAPLSSPVSAPPPGWFPLRRTADAVPVILGSVLGVLMVVVFSAAAVFVRLAR